MDNGEFSEEIEAARKRVEELRRRAASSVSQEGNVTAVALEELHTAFEELQVADEELRQQNEELLVTRYALEHRIVGA